MTSQPFPPRDGSPAEPQVRKDARFGSAMFREARRREPLPPPWSEANEQTVAPRRFSELEGQEAP